MAITLELPIKKVVAYSGPLYEGPTYNSEWIAGYNDNYIQWKSDSAGPDSAGTVLRGEIWIGDYKFTNLIANADSVFTFNIIEAVKTILGKFGDTYLHNLADIIYFDDSLFKLIAIKVKIEFVDNSKEELDTSILAARAVHQIGDRFGETMLNHEPQIEGGNCHVLLPSEKIRFQQTLQQGFDYNQTVTIFKGYPFDIGLLSHYENNALRIIVTDLEDTSLSETTTAVPVSESIMVRRVILSDGAALHADIAGLTLDQKYRMILQFNPGQENTQFPFNFIIKEACGIYLKWLNSAGGWSYFLFNKYFRMPMAAKSKGQISDYQTTMIGSTGNYTNIGQAIDVNFLIHQRFLEPHEHRAVMELPSSPMIYLYTGTRGQQPTQFDWTKVTIDDFKGDQRDNKRKLYDVSFALSLPNQYAQTL